MLKRIFKILIFFNILFAVGLAKAEDIPLPAEEAFVFSAYLEKPARLIIEWQVAPGYYLYRDKLYLRAEPVSALKKDQIKWPASKNKLDPIRGSFRAYEGHVHLVLPLSQALEQERSFTIQYQGCSQSGFCYAPVKKRLDLHYPFSAEGLKGAPLLIVSEASAKSSSIKTVSRASNLLIDQGATQTFLSEHNFIMSILCFLGLGLLLAFTPCILPMIPILSSIIVGQKKLTTRKAFRLSLSYVLGMALTYAIAGLAITWVGSSIQIYFQNPWVISGLSAIFILLALSMADLFVLPLPAWQRNLIAWQHGRQGGHYFGVFLMGSLSTLIMSPCVTAPLIGILAYLSETGNLLLGASALFTLGLGMGLPLLLLGFSAGKYLPRTGHWMMIIKKFFAFLLVGMAIAMLSRILPSAVTLFLWASLLIAMAIFLFFVEGLSRLSRYSAYLVGGLFVLYAFILFIGVSLNFTSPFYPFESRFFKTGFVTAKQTSSQFFNFTTIKSMAQLDHILAKARREGKSVMLDFYAAWCESCQAVEKKVLSKPEVQNSLRRFVVLRADVTENTPFIQALFKRYQVVAPPTFLFFNRQGQEVMEKRIVGEVDYRVFLDRAKTI